jgi:hypothetical protein
MPRERKWLPQEHKGLIIGEDPEVSIQFSLGKNIE